MSSILLAYVSQTFLQMHSHFCIMKPKQTAKKFQMVQPD